MSSKNPNVTESKKNDNKYNQTNTFKLFILSLKTPSLVQLLIFPVSKLPISGRNTINLKTTSVCDDPKKMNSLKKCRLIN